MRKRKNWPTQQESKRLVPLLELTNPTYTYTHTHTHTHTTARTKLARCRTLAQANLCLCRALSPSPSNACLLPPYDALHSPPHLSLACSFSSSLFLSLPLRFASFVPKCPVVLSLPSPSRAFPSLFSPRSQHHAEQTYLVFSFLSPRFRFFPPRPLVLFPLHRPVFPIPFKSPFLSLPFPVMFFPRGVSPPPPAFFPSPPPPPQTLISLLSSAHPSLPFLAASFRRARPLECVLSRSPFPWLQTPSCKRYERRKTPRRSAFHSSRLCRICVLFRLLFSHAVDQREGPFSSVSRTRLLPRARALLPSPSLSLSLFLSFFLPAERHGDDSEGETTKRKGARKRRRDRARGTEEKKRGRDAGMGVHERSGKREGERGEGTRRGTRGKGRGRASSRRALFVASALGPSPLSCLSRWGWKTAAPLASDAAESSLAKALTLPSEGLWGAR